MDIGPIIRGLTREGGSLAVSFHDGKWITALEFGQEAEDSPMVGGAAYGVGDTAEDAIRQLTDQTGWK